MTDMPPARRINAGELTLSVHEAGPETGPLVVLLHGWPETALTWAGQIEALAAAGYRCAAPDLRGFGASDAPHAVEDYAIDRLVADLDGLITALGRDQAVVVGHDWGGILMWHAACLIPQRFQAAIGVNTPHLPRGARPPTEVFREHGGEEHYILRFQDEAMDGFFEGRERAFFDFVYGAPPPVADLEKLPASVTHLPRRFERFLERGGLKSEEDVVAPPDVRAAMADAYARSGFRGGMNLYRNMDANWERMGGVDHRLSMPCYMISAECDFMLPPKLAGWMPALCPDLELDLIPEIGHWTQHEAGEGLNARLLDWLGRRAPPH